MVAALQKPLVAFLLRSPGLFHTDSCASPREIILYFSSPKSLTEANLRKSPRDWGLAQIGKLAHHRHLTRVTGGNQKQNWDWDSSTDASRHVLGMSSAGLLLPQCMHTTYPLPHAMEIATRHGQLTNLDAGRAVGLRRSFGRSMDLL